MARRQIVMVEPRLISQTDLAALLGRSTTWLRDHWAELYDAGLPKPLAAPFAGSWDRRAVEAWLDRLSGQASELPPPSSRSFKGARIG